MAPPVEAKRICRTPPWRAASARFRLPRMLTSASNMGSSTERRTSIWAAWWTRISTPDSRTRAAASLERMSRTCSSAPSGTFSRRPPERLSMISTRRPVARKASATWEPMKPAPPVTQTVPLAGSFFMVPELSKRRARPGDGPLLPPADRDDPQPLPGQQAVQPADERHAHVEDLELGAAEVAALEHLAVEPPAGHRGAVEVVHHLDGEAGRAELLAQHLRGVAAAMAEDLVEAGVELLARGHVEHQPAAGGQHVVHVAQGEEGIADVLQHVQADHRVELPVPGLEGPRVLEVDAGHLEVGLAEGEVLQIVDVVRVDVAREIEVARQQPGGDVADAGADLQHPGADVGRDRLGHPAVEALGPFEAGEDVGAVLVLGVDVVEEAVLDDRPQGLEGVLPADLLAFAVGAAEVADGHLEDPALALGDLGRDLRLHGEVVGADGDRLDQRCPEDLVAGLHVRQVEVGEPVAERGQHPVAEAVAIVEDPAAVAGQETRAVDHVGAVFQEGPHQARIVSRVVLEVGVLEEDEVAGRFGDAAADGGPLALVLPLLEQSEAVRILGGELPQELQAAVLGAVVDDQDLHLEDLRRRHGEHPVNELAHQEALVVHRDDDAQLDAGRRSVFSQGHRSLISSSKAVHDSTGAKEEHSLAGSGESGGCRG